MDFIRHALKSKEKFATERLHDNYRKMFKLDPCIIHCDEESSTISNGYIYFFERFKLVEVSYLI